MPAAALRGALPAAALRAGALPAVAAVPTPPACDRRMPSTRRTSSRPSAWTLCAAPRPSPRCGARSERGVLACAPSEKSHRGDRREAGQVPAGARARHAPLTCPRRAPTVTARAAASAGPLASSAHGCRLLLRAAVGHCRAGALPDDHEQLLPREPGHHDRVRRDRLPVRALGAPCLAVVVPPLRGHSAGRSFDNVEYWLDEVDKYAGPHVQKVRAPNSDTRLCLCLWDSVPVPVSVLSVSVSVSVSLSLRLSVSLSPCCC